MTKIYMPLNIQRFASGIIDMGQSGKLFAQIVYEHNSNGSLANNSNVTGSLQIKKSTSTATTGTWTGRFKVGSQETNIRYKGSIKNNWVTVATLSDIIQHNEDGTGICDIEAEIFAPTGTSMENDSLGIVTGIILDNIPRYASVDQSFASATETSITMNWLSDSICDYLWYKFDALDGSHSSGGYIDGRSVNGTSGQYTIFGLQAGKEYSIVTKVRRKDSQLNSSYSGDTLASTYFYPYANSMPKFTIGKQLTIRVYNPLNRKIQVWLILNDGSEVGGDIIDGDIIEGYTNDKFIKAFYNSIPNTPEGNYQVKIYAVDLNHSETRSGSTYSIDYDNSKPIFTHFEYEDVNDITYTLTKNRKSIIDGYSTIGVTISAENKATAYEGAEIKNYTINGTSYQYAENFYQEIFNFNAPELKVYAVDTRDNSKPVEEPIKLLGYTKVAKGDFFAERSNEGVGTQVTFNFQGNFWNKNFGDVDNSLSAKYRFKKTGATEYGNEISIDSSLINVDENGNYSFSSILQGDLEEDNGFDIESSYNVEITISDELSSAVFIYTVIEGSPAVDLYGNCISLGAPYNENIGGRVQIGGKKYVENDLKFGRLRCGIDENGFTLPASVTTKFPIKSMYISDTGGQVSIGGDNSLVFTDRVKFVNVEFHDYISNGFNIYPQMWDVQKPMQLAGIQKNYSFSFVNAKNEWGYLVIPMWSSNQLNFQYDTYWNYIDVTYLYI